MTAEDPEADVLTESQRFQVQQARDILGTWDLADIDPVVAAQPWGEAQADV